ncbi:MAG: dCTP deaminase [Peptostreptococcaceae bacterium]
MALLTGKEIVNRVESGKITISDFNQNRLGPNGYNLRLSNKLMVYTDEVLDMKKDNPTKELIIPEEGLLLEPGVLYLGMTEEYTESHDTVPFLEGRSSTGRLGLDIHVCAGAGEIGFCGNWTLEIRVIHPLRVYAGTEVCQIMFHTVEGDDSIKYTGKYQNSKEIRPSRLFQDFSNK